jgi:tRNA(Ile)-lysidine synthase
MKFEFAVLEQALAPINNCKSVVVGLSGGMDSMVLLHGLLNLKEQGKASFEVRAVHVNHGLQTEADEWQEFCEQACAKLEVDLYCEKVQIAKSDNDTVAIESKARLARYKVFEAQLQDDEALLLAHHLDDQLETLVFRLNRGASVKGLSAIPQRRSFKNGFIFRPLLHVDRVALQKFAEVENLQWVEDLSNQDLQFDRNYIRHEILPAIESRWPEYRLSWSKSLLLVSEASEMLDELADLDLEHLQSNEPTILSIVRLQLLSSSRQRNVIRRWLEKLGLPDLGWNRLHHFASEFVVTDKQSDSSLTIEGNTFACYQDHLYLLPKLGAPQESVVWQVNDSAELELVNNGSLLAKEVSTGGLARSFSDKIEIRFRQGGESCRLVGRPTKSLKKILQEAHIEPWLRDRVPLLYRDEELICIPGIGVCEHAAVKSGETGIEVIWQRPVAESLS